MTDQLLRHFSLSGSQLVKIHADMLKPVPAGGQCQAKVEVKLAPSRNDGENQPANSFLVGVRLYCEGTPPTGQPQERLFTIEIVVNLVYVQFSGDPVSFEDFAQNHGSLSRQIYPLMQQQATGLLNQLGLSMVRLPLDLAEGGQIEGGRLH